MPQDPYFAAAPVGPGRSLAAAIAVFLGGYLLLTSLAAGQLSIVASGLFATLFGRPSQSIPVSLGVLVVLQFFFAMAVVVAGLQLGRGPLIGRLIGSVLVVFGSLLTFAVVGLRIVGLLPFPGGRDGIPFQAVFANPWFAIVLFVGIAWLLSRQARLGWLSLLGTLVLIPLPIAMQFAGAESGAAYVVMYLLAGIVGAGIILAGRPLRD